MSTWKAIAIDDDPMAHESLKFLSGRTQKVEIIEHFESAIDARKWLEENETDAIFLDVEMPELSGLEFLSLTQNLPEIILITSKREYAVDAFEFEVLDYLPKPIALPRFLKAIDRLDEKLQSNNQQNEDSLFVRSEGKWVRIAFEDILWVETMDDYVVFRCKNKEKYIVHGTLTKMENNLPAEQFQKTHRSYIVCLSAIKDIADTNLVIDGTVIPISRAYKPKLMERLRLL